MNEECWADLRNKKICNDNNKDRTLVINLMFKHLDEKLLGLDTLFETSFEKFAVRCH